MHHPPKSQLLMPMTFLFDIGNVLLKLHFDRFHTTVLGAPGAPLPSSLEQFKIPYETGEISDEEFIESSLKLLTSDLTPAQFAAAWQDIFSLNEPMWEVVQKLKAQNHRLILFSNTNSLHATHFLAEYPQFSLFDHHHFSQEVRTMKPHPDFYQQAITQYQLDPARTLYLDDLPENIATGRQLGFPSWQYDYRDHQACLEWLSRQGVNLGGEKPES